MSTKVTTGKVRLSYAKVWAPEKNDEGVEKYSTALIISKDDTATLDKIKAAVDEVAAEVKAKNKGKLLANFKLPLRDGDEEKPDLPEYANSYFLNCSSKQKPAIVGLEKDADSKWKRITDESQVYSGCYARVSLNFFAFDAKGNRGIGAGLNNIQKVADGEKLAGGSAPESDFDEYEMDELEA